MSSERATFVLDNGAYEIKAGFTGLRAPIAFYHGIARSRDRRMLVGDDIRGCRDMSGILIRRPIERGQLCSWEAEKIVWDALFTKLNLSEPADTNLLLSEAPFTLPHLSSNTDQIVFEEYEFGGYLRQAPQAYAAWDTLGMSSKAPECSLVIDVGHTATHIVPVIRGSAYVSAIRRIDIGGKTLTNDLKDQITFRHIDLTEETVIVNAIKEATCFVPLNHPNMLRMFRDKRLDALPPPAGYALPDSQGLYPLGRMIRTMDEVRDVARENNEQVLTLGRERFNVPESLFRPLLLGINQCGIPEAAAAAVDAVPNPHIRELLWSRVVIVGGSSLIPGLFERLKVELRPWVPEDYQLNVSISSDPIFAAYRGAEALADNHNALNAVLVTRQEYLEHGESFCKRRFRPSNSLPDRF